MKRVRRKPSNTTMMNLLHMCRLHFDCTCCSWAVIEIHIILLPLRHSPGSSASQILHQWTILIWIHPKPRYAYEGNLRVILFYFQQRIVPRVSCYKRELNIMVFWQGTWECQSWVSTENVKGKHKTAEVISFGGLDNFRSCFLLE